MGVSQVRDTVSGGRHNKDHRIMRSILSSPYFGKLPYGSYTVLYRKTWVLPSCASWGQHASSACPASLLFGTSAVGGKWCSLGIVTDRKRCFAVSCWNFIHWTMLITIREPARVPCALISAGLVYHPGLSCLELNRSP